MSMFSTLAEVTSDSYMEGIWIRTNEYAFFNPVTGDSVYIHFETNFSLIWETAAEKKYTLLTAYDVDLVTFVFDEIWTWLQENCQFFLDTEILVNEYGKEEEIEETEDADSE